MTTRMGRPPRNAVPANVRLNPEVLARLDAEVKRRKAEGSKGVSRATLLEEAALLLLGSDS